MAVPRAAAGKGIGEAEIRELLKEIDSNGLTSSFIEKRDDKRRKFKTQCEIRHIAPDGQTVVTTSAITRNISRGGLSFIARDHYTREAFLFVTVTFAEGTSKNVAGQVVYSRLVREGAYLTGMKFGRIDDARLIPGAHPQTPPQDAPSTAPREQRSRDVPKERPEASSTTGDRMLQMLAAAGAARILPKEKISAVVAASHYPDHKVRRQSIPVLMQIERQHGIVALVSLVDDANPTVQAEAAQALGQLRATEAIDSLRRLLRHANEEVALSAAEALGRMDDTSGCRIAARLVSKESPINRAAARTLGIILNQHFRPNAEGVAAARRYLKKHKMR